MNQAVQNVEPISLSPAQVAELRKPLDPKAISPHPTKSFLSTIKAIYVVERLNAVFGIGGWFIKNEVVEAGEKNIVVKSTFHAPKYGIYIPDIFGGNDNADRGDAFKGACTDALTKIGSYLEIGIDVFKGLHDNKTQKTEPQRATETPKKWTKPEAKKTEKVEEVSNKFVDVIDAIGKELNEVTGIDLYARILKKEGESLGIEGGFKSSSEIKARMTQEDAYKNTKGALELVRSLLGPFGIAGEDGVVHRISKLSELEKDDRDKILNQLDMVTGL